MKVRWMLLLIGLIVLAVGANTLVRPYREGAGEGDPGLPPGPAMVMFYTDG